MKNTKRGLRSKAAMIVAKLLIAYAAVAQSLPVEHRAPLDFAVTYDALHSNHVGAQDFWMQGGAVELGAQLHRGLGIAARVEGLHAGTSSTTGVPLDLVTTVFGPRYTIEVPNHRYAIFGEALVGVSNGFHSLFSQGSGPIGSVNAGTTSSSNAFALDIGGGVDVRFNRRFALRAFRASYLRSQFSNSFSNIQNNLSLDTGVVLRFGR